MNLESLIMQVRPRTPWESMDLAVRLAVSLWRPLLSSWLVTILPLMFIVSLILLDDHPYWAFFLIWFLKPLYDRVPLFVLSRAVFSEKVSWKDTLNAIPSLLKTGVFSTLTLYRLDPSRAFALPVRQLEGLQGKRRRQRMDTLQRGVNNREILFFILCFHLEALITWGVLGLLLMMLPADMALEGAESFFLDTEPGLLINSLSMILYFLVMMVVEILYVAGGFVLYLNRRIILEGWDIELIFRKLEQRQNSREKDKQSLRATAVAALLLTLFTAMSPVDTLAADPETSPYEKILPPIAQPPLAPEDSGRVIKAVMADPVFNRFKTIETLKYTGSRNNKDEQELHSTRSWLTDLFETIGNTIAFVFEVGLWLLALSAIFLLIKFRDRLHLGFKSKPEKPLTPMPDMLFGLDLREESLPEDVVAQAMALVQQHNYRAALALLYRATLAHLVKHHEFTLEQGATEGDCLDLVTRKLAIPSQDEIEYFVELTRAWQLTAYGHREVPAKQMKHLCLNWSRYYQPTQSDVAGTRGEVDG